MGGLYYNYYCFPPVIKPRNRYRDLVFNFSKFPKFKPSFIITSIKAFIVYLIYIVVEREGRKDSQASAERIKELEEQAETRSKRELISKRKSKVRI